ncbi:MAG: efflux RND transporter permease subunit [Thermoguttaceae bacterium]
MRSTLPLVVALLLASSGCLHPAGNGPVIVVTASYPGASAEVIADTVAAPLEQQILGVESMLRLESESRNDGSYVAWVRLQPGADAKLVATLVQNRVALANPDLPEAVARGGVTVTARAAKEVEKDAAIALEDRGGQGQDALQQFSQAVLKRLAAEGAIVKPAVFPGASKPQLSLQIDRQKCARYGVSIADVTKAVQAAPPGSKIGALEKVSIRLADGKAIALGRVATLDRVICPAGVYRVDMYPAVRISGSPPEGMTREAAAARWAELAEAERQQHAAGLAVVNLTSPQ